MSAAIKNKFGVQVKLVESSGGVFEVYQGDKLIFSKKKTKKFPKVEEVLKSLAAGATDKDKKSGAIDKDKKSGAIDKDKGNASE